MANVHFFDTPIAAYDASQTGIAEHGDILIVASKKIVGISDTWPIAITVRTGEFHTVAEGYKLTEFFDQESIDLAKAEADKLGAKTIERLAL